MFYKSFYNMKYFRLLTTVLVAGAFGVAGQQNAQAVTFNFSYGTNTPQEVIDSTALAGDIWSSQLSDDVALNIHIDFGALSDGLLGGARPNMVRVKYKDVLTAMLLDTTSSDDQLAFENIQTDEASKQSFLDYQAGNLKADDLSFSDESSFALLLQSSRSDKAAAEHISKGSFLDNDRNNNNKSIWMTRANAKALGLIDRSSQDFDATIRFTDSVLWDWDRSDGIAENELDFLTVAQHEIGHALGIVSGSDVAAALSRNSDKALDDKELRYVGTMDLFRFSEESANATWQTKDGQEQQGAADWTLGRVDEAGNPIDYYFSLDGGQTKIASLAKGLFGEGSDGFQASHWAANGEAPLGIMHPSLALGERLDISVLDTQLLDVLGWDLRSVTGESPAFSKAALFTKESLVKEFWSLALDSSALSSWLEETEETLSEYVVDEQSKLVSEQQRLAQKHLELTQTLQTLSELRDVQKESGDDVAEKQTKEKIEDVKRQLKQLKEADKAIKKTGENLIKWQEKLLEELEEQYKIFDKEKEKDLLKRVEKFQQAQDKALQELAEQEGLDSSLTLGGWSITDYSYRFWQTIDIESGDDDSLATTVFQMKAVDEDVAKTPEPTATLGLLALGLLGIKISRKQK